MMHRVDASISIVSMRPTCQDMYRSDTFERMKNAPSVLLLERIGALMQHAVREDALRHGLQPIHLHVLQYLRLANRYSDMPIAVAEYLGITRGTASQSLALLERKGYLVKEADSQHGRRVHLTLTPAAQALLDDGWAQRVDRASNAPSGRSLDTSLTALLLGLQRANRQRAFGVCKQCDHFLREPGSARCGLTGEPLAAEQTVRICREWTAPASS